jgi:beta-lactamase class C
MKKMIAGTGFLIVSIVLFLSIGRFPAVMPEFFNRGESSEYLSKTQVDSAFQYMVHDFLLEIDSMFEKNKVPGLAISIVRDGEIIENRVWGYSDLNTKRKLDTLSVFRLASVSKGFAPFIVGKLVDRGFITWDDPVKKFMPEFQLSNAEATENLTIRHLLSHTTGLPRHTFSNLLDQEQDINMIIHKLKEVPVKHTPGTYYDYQNVTYGLLANIVENITNKSYSQLLEEWIFLPAGMHTSSGTYGGIMKSADIAFPHTKNRKGYVRSTLSPRYYSVGPAAGVNASITDMGKWMKTLQTRSTLMVSDSTLHEIFKPQIRMCTCESNFFAWEGKLQSASYGFGWRILEFNHSKIYYHGGNVNQYRSEIALDPERKIGITILQNAPGGFISKVIPLFWQRLDSIVPKEKGV